MGIDEILERARGQRIPTPEVCRALRRRAGLTQTDLAEVLGIDRASVARYELGTRRPRGETAAAYRQLLDRLAREAVA